MKHLGLALLCSGLGALSCTTSSGGPAPITLGLSVSEGAAAFVPLRCLRLPVLLGSINQEEVDLPGGARIRVTATRDAAKLAFLGGSEQGPLEIPASVLVGNTYSKDVELGVDVTLRLFSGCSAVPGDAGGAVDGAGGSGAGGLSPTGAGGLGAGGSGGAPAPLSVQSMQPEDGPYGTEVVIRGTGLGSAARPEVAVVLGAESDIELLPSSAEYVVGWTESEVRFRFPFPALGSVVVQGSSTTLSAGVFTSTWEPGPSFRSGAALVALASLSAGPGRILVALDAVPPTLLEHDGASFTAGAIDVTDIRADTLRLYLDGTTVRGFALSTAEPPEIVALEPDADPDTVDLVGEPTGVVATSEFAVAGGQSGAVVWFREGDDWRAARPGAAGWARELGPVADPNPSGSHHAAAATSDGALYVAWAEGTGSLFDDMGAPFAARLSPGSTAFESDFQLGSDIDDSVSSIDLEGRGDGIVARYCGTDVDPLGATGSERVCRAALLTSSGVAMDRAPKESEVRRYALRAGAIGAVLCDPDAGIQPVPDLVLDGAPGAPAREVAAWPCGGILAAEYDTQGELRMLLRYGSLVYGPARR